MKEGGTFSEWNSQHPSEAEVNGIAVDEVYEIAIRELHKAIMLRRRGSSPANLPMNRKASAASGKVGC